MTKAVSVHVTGRVQGVGFRYHAVEEARRLGVTGWVSNEPDQSVAGHVEGDEAVFIRFMERGRVDDLERSLDLLDWTRLNEFKRTKLPR